MKFHKLILFILTNIKRNSKRTFLTILGVIIGIAAVITIVSLGEAIKKKQVSEVLGNESGEIALSVSVFNKTTMEPVAGEEFNDSDIELIRSISEVKSVKIVENSDSIESAEVNILGEKHNEILDKVTSTNKSDILGRNLTEEDNKNSSRYIVINKSSLEKYYNDTDKLLHSIATINGVNFEIVGIIKDSDGGFNFGSGSVSISENAYNEYFKNAKKSKNLEVSLNADVDTQVVTDKIVKELNENGSQNVIGQYNVMNSQELFKVMTKVFDTLTLFVASVAGISLFISAIGVMNMIFTSVSERETEIGIRRALGAKRKDIVNEFLLEGSIITIIGGIIGYILGTIIANIVGIFIKMPVGVSLFTAIIAISISVIVGVLASIVPARKAANTNTVDLLY